jgi:hypothetical protein
MRCAGVILLILISFASNAQEKLAIEKKQNQIPSDISLRSDTDSLKSKIADDTDSLKKINNFIVHFGDSLTPDYKKYTHRLDSVKGKLKNRIDSLNKLGLPHLQYTKSLDSLTKLNPTKEFQKVQHKVTSQGQKVSEKLNQPVKEVNDKISNFSKQAQVQGGSLPGVNTPKINTNVSQGMPTGNGAAGTSKDPSSQESSALQNGVAKNLNSNAKNIVPAGEEKEIQQISGDAKKDVSSYSSDAKNITNGNLSEVKTIDKDIRKELPSKEIAEAQKDFQQGNKDVSTYSSDAKKIAKGDIDDPKLEKDIESAIPAAEKNELQKQVQAADQQKAMLKTLQDKQEFKKHTLARARKMAVEQLAAQSKQIQPLISKINQYQKNSDDLIRQTKGLPKQRPPRESVPPLIERFVPGVLWQIQKSNLWLIDINPSVRFRAKKLISIGSGWNERIALDQAGKYKPEGRVYGLRNFAEVTIRKGFAARFDTEYMNAFVPVSFQQQDVGERKWVWSYFVGIKKDFSFGRGVMGNVQLMYVIFDPKNQSPYLTKLNARFGFEFPFKVKRKRM